MTRLSKEAVQLKQSAFIASYCVHGIKSKACKDANISRPAVDKWFMTNKFKALLKDAMDDQIALIEAVFKMHTKKSWQACGKWLEVHHPTKWNIAKKLEHSGDAEKPIAATVIFKDPPKKKK